ncbi:MAG: hypothetical protein ACT4OO_00190 [Nitrospiraceae bacterium]
MATVAMGVPQPHPGETPGVFLSLQKVYTFKMAVSMALYACLFFVLAFCGPYVLPAMTLLSDAPLGDRQVAASQLLLLSDTIWVAIPVFFLGAILFSLLATRRVVGALERLGQSAGAWAAGKLSHRVCFREADRLENLAQSLNHAVNQVEGGLGSLQQHTQRARAALDNLMKSCADGSTPLQESMATLRTVADALEQSQQTLNRFEFRRSTDGHA